MAGSEQPAVVVEGLSKSFRLPHERVHTLKERVLHPTRRASFDRLDALQDISFDVAPGEFFGIVGRNGSGKSTLLKCLAGIYKADAGRIWMNGRLSTFIELGVGFNPDLAARDNVILNAIMLGLSPREARERVDRVIAFAELEEFSELKLKNYSSGMHVRLAFSVMIQVDADIHVIDEVLAVGDASFQQKCFDEFHRLQREGRTILFVTHDMSAVSRFCDRALLLERGEPVAIGKPEAIAEQYLAQNFARGQAVRTTLVEEPGAPLTPVVVREVWFEDEFGLPSEYLPHGPRCAFKATVEFREALSEVGFQLGLENDADQQVFTTATADGQRRSFQAGEVATFAVDFENRLAPGWRYHANFTIDAGGDATTIERRDRVGSVVVTGARNIADRVELEHEIRMESDPSKVT